MRLVFDNGGTITDEGALSSLAAALTANSSMKRLNLYWSSTHPDSTLKKIGECVRNKPKLYELELIMNMPLGKAPVAEERAKEWLQCVEVGGKELIQSLEDSHHYSNLRDLRFLLDSRTKAYMSNQYSRIFKQSIRALRATAAAVNTAREQKGLDKINTWLIDNTRYTENTTDFQKSLALADFISRYEFRTLRDDS